MKKYGGKLRFALDKLPQVAGVAGWDGGASDLTWFDLDKFVHDKTPVEV